MDWTGSILAFVEAHFCEEIYSETVAEHFGISQGHLCRLFKERTGKRLVGFLHQVRVEEAKRLLRESKDCIYQIADLVGFKDPDYFSRVFRKVTGECPGTYRRRYFEKKLS